MRPCFLQEEPSGEDDEPKEELQESSTGARNFPLYDIKKESILIKFVQFLTSMECCPNWMPFKMLWDIIRYPSLKMMTYLMTQSHQGNRLSEQLEDNISQKAKQGQFSSSWKTE